MWDRLRVRAVERLLASAPVADIASKQARTSLRQERRRSQRARARATFLTRLMEADDVDGAVCATAREMHTAHEKARSVQVVGEMAAGLLGADDGARVTTAIASSMWYPPRWPLTDDQLSLVRRRSLVHEFAPAVAVRAALHTGRLDAVDEVLANISAARTRDLVSMAETLLAFRERSRLRLVLRELKSRKLGGRLTARVVRTRRWARRWSSSSPSAPSDGVTLAVLTPEGPDPATRASIGRHLSLAAVLEVVEQAAPNTPVMHVPQHFPEAAVPPPGAVLVVTNDAVSRLFGLRQATPVFPGVRQLYLGWTPGTGSGLSPEVLAAMKHAQPIGCADWAGVDLLLGAGIDAFRSGPAAAMLDSSFVRNRPAQEREPRALGRARGEANWAWSVARPLQSRMDRTTQHLASMVAAGRVVTADPDLAAGVVAVGGRVRPKPARPGDPGWDGLADLGSSPDRHTQLGARLRGALAETVARAAAGADDREVYQAWAASWAADVADARRRHGPVAAVAPPFDVGVTAATVRAGLRALGPRERPDEVHVAMASDANLVDQVPVAIDAVVRHTTRPVTLWMLCRGFSVDYQEWLGRIFPDTRLMFLPCDDVSYPEARLLVHITPSTMDRLLLPELVVEVEKLIYLDIDALVLDDVGTLADMDLGGHPMAARATYDFPQTRLFASIHRRSQGLPPDEASELRRRMHMRYPRDVFGFNAGVLVMDLDRLRADQFCTTYLGWPTRYGLHDQELLIYAFAEDRAELPQRWNMWPAHEPIDDPAVLHWLGPYKPWKPIRVPEQRRWWDAAEHLRRRIGAAGVRPA